MSLHALPVHVALVDRTDSVSQDELAAVAGALNRQVQEDFAPIWQVRATVGAYASPPAGTWTIYLDHELDEPGALGYHTDEHGQPVAYVDDDGEWTVTMSHELLEMLADPFGMHMHSGRLPWGVSERFKEFGLKGYHSNVSYLLEVCDPPERISYDVGGILVSDFILPTWYRANPPNRPCSFISGITPRTILEGGYVSFHVHGDWWQVYNVRDQYKTAHLGRFDRERFGSVREFTDFHAKENRE
jgi:hypothetical protein